MDAQRIAVDALVALTDCDRDAAIAFIRKFYLAGVRDPKRLTFKGLQALRGDVNDTLIPSSLRTQGPITTDIRC
ncbi:hypothetical protein [Bradyrhizobium sp. RDI18]